MRQKSGQIRRLSGKVCGAVQHDFCRKGKNPAYKT